MLGPNECRGVSVLLAALRGLPGGELASWPGPCRIESVPLVPLPQLEPGYASRRLFGFRFDRPCKPCAFTLTILRNNEMVIHLGLEASNGRSCVFRGVKVERQFSWELGASEL